MIDESGGPPNESEPTGGQGGSPRGESGLTPSEENKLVGMVLNERLKRNDLVFPTTDRHDEVAVGVTARNMGSKDGRISNGAVSNYIKMKQLNQKQQHFNRSQEKPSSQTNIQINGAGPVQVYLPTNQR